MREREFRLTPSERTELNDRLTQIYFSHSEVPEAFRGV